MRVVVEGSPLVDIYGAHPRWQPQRGDRSTNVP